MKEQEAIKELKSLKEDDHRIYAEEYEALEIAIQTLAEIQEYRAIGTVQQCKEAVEKQETEEVCNMHRSEDEADIVCYGEDALFGRCPCCTSFNNSLWNNNFCGECGQKLDWSRG